MLQKITLRKYFLLIISEILTSKISLKINFIHFWCSVIFIRVMGRASFCWQTIRTKCVWIKRAAFVNQKMLRNFPFMILIPKNCWWFKNYVDLKFNLILDSLSRSGLVLVRETKVICSWENGQFSLVFHLMWLQLTTVNAALQLGVVCSKLWEIFVSSKK